jgi:hypothetical protein
MIAIIVSLLFLTLVPLQAAAQRVAAKEAAPVLLSEPWETSLNLSPKIKYIQASIFGQGSVPTYKGWGYGGEIEYIIGPPAFMIGPYAELVSVGLDNTGNTGEQSETLKGTFYNLGLKLNSQLVYLRVGASEMRLKDRASGTVNNTKSFKSRGLELGAGINYAFNDYIAASAGLDLSYYKISPADNDITSRLDYMSYAFVLSLRFSLPSGGSGKKDSW